MQNALKKKGYNCKDISAFKIILGSCVLLCFIITIGVLVWWIRVKRAAKVVVGAFEDND